MGDASRYVYGWRLFGQHSEWCEVAESLVNNIYCHAQRLCYGLDSLEGYGILSSLDAGEVSALDARLLCQLFLAHSRQLAQRLYAEAYAGAGVLLLFVCHSRIF